MPFSGGVYSLPAGNPVVTGTTITTTWANSTLNDISTALSTCVLKDGTQTITANIPMGGFKFTGLNGGSAAGDSLRYEQLYSATGITLIGPVSMGGFHIYGLASGSGTGQAVNWNQTAPGIMTATGDLLYASAANTPARLAISSGLPLVATATSPQWGFGNQNANTIFAGPASGAAAQPTLRAPVGADSTTVLIGAVQVANASGTIDFTSTNYPAAFDGSMTNITFFMEGVRTTTDALIFKTQMATGSAVWQTSGYEDSGLATISGSGVAGPFGAPRGYISLSGENLVGNAATKSVNMTLKFSPDPSGTAFSKTLKWDGNFVTDGGVIGNLNGTGRLIAAPAITGIRFFFGTTGVNTIAVGKFGVKGDRPA